MVILRLRRSSALLQIRGASTGKAILDSLRLDLIISEPGQLMRRLDIANLLAIALGKDDVNLLQGATSRLGIEEVHGRNEDGVHNSKEQIRAPANGIHHDGGDHDDGKVE